MSEGARGACTGSGRDAGLWRQRPRGGRRGRGAAYRLAAVVGVGAAGRTGSGAMVPVARS